MSSVRRWMSTSPSLVDHVRRILQNNTSQQLSPPSISKLPSTKPADVLRRIVVADTSDLPKTSAAPSMEKDDSVISFFNALYDTNSNQSQITTRDQRLKDKERRQREYEERVARRNRKKFVRTDRPERTRKVLLSEGSKITIRDASKLMMIPMPRLIGALRRLGERIPRRGNQAEYTVTTETIQIAALDLDLSFDIELRPFDIEKDDEKFVESRYEQANGDASTWPKRPIVVSIVGHVDHGKTTLLDTLRSSRIAAGEFGGITQRIGAFTLPLIDDCTATVLDTPGHGAFMTMRANACRLTDVVVLVVAADASVQAQTVASIQAIMAEGLPFIVAISKSDLPSADIDRVKRDLMDHGIVCESLGGDISMIPVSSVTKQGLDELKEAIALVGEMVEPAAPIEGPARAVVIDCHIERGRGTMVSAIVRRGTLRIGDVLLSGTHFGVVKAMYDDAGKSVKFATPSQAVQLSGLKESPEPGSDIVVVDSEQRARRMSSKRAWLIEQEQLVNSRLWTPPAESESKSSECSEEPSGPKCLRVIVRADMSGSLTALSEFIRSLPQEKVVVQVMSQAIGNITQQDLDLAKQSGATIFGFNVTMPSSLKRFVKEFNVDIKIQRIIYKMMDDIVDSVNTLMPSQQVVESLGRAEIATVFELRGNRGKIANRVGGCRVVAGKISRSALARVIRSGEPIWEGSISSLKHFKDDVPAVEKGSECGIALDGFQDIQQGDIIECFQNNLVQEKLVVKSADVFNRNNMKK